MPVSSNECCIPKQRSSPVGTVANGQIFAGSDAKRNVGPASLGGRRLVSAQCYDSNKNKALHGYFLYRHRTKSDWSVQRPETWMVEDCRFDQYEQPQSYSWMLISTILID